jgi:hypothetical protein
MTSYDTKTKKLTIDARDATAKALYEYIQDGGGKARGKEIINATGLGLELHKNARVAQAIADPDAYLKSRTKLIEDLSKEIEEKFNADYMQLFGMGVPKEQAEKVAKDSAISYGQLQMAKINVDYPADIINASLETMAGAQGTAKRLKGTGFLALTK